MNKAEDFLRDDIDTYEPKFKLLVPLCKFEVKRFNSLLRENGK